jgi:hypothetical protein
MVRTSIIEMPTPGLATNAVARQATATSCGRANRDFPQHVARRGIDERERAGVPEEHEQTLARRGLRGCSVRDGQENHPRQDESHRAPNLHL